MSVISVRNTGLAQILKGQSLSVDFMSDVLDFKEMNNGMIQIITEVAPNAMDGSFYLTVSLLPEEETFIRLPDSERAYDGDCLSHGWTFFALPFRYARVCYTKGTVTTGSIDIYARAKRT